MFIVRRLSRLSRTIQFALVAVAAFAIGTATVAVASTAGLPIGTLFYLTMINGAATTPCSSTAGTLGATTTCNAVVDSNGDLHVSGTSTVSGTVGVNNFPGDQQVHGTVGVNNFPADQQVHGTVGVSNFPADQQVHGSVTGHVNVDNLPASQTVNGTVNVGNLPSTQTVHVDNFPATQNVNIVGGASTTAGPVATRALPIQGTLGHGSTNFDITLPVGMKMTFLSLSGCSLYRFNLSGGGNFDLTSAGITQFPIPIDVSSVRIVNLDSFSDCTFDARVVGY